MPQSFQVSSRLTNPRVSSPPTLFPPPCAIPFHTLLSLTLLSLSWRSSHMLNKLFNSFSPSHFTSTSPYDPIHFSFLVSSSSVTSMCPNQLRWLHRFHETPLASISLSYFPIPNPIHVVSLVHFYPLVNRCHPPSTILNSERYQYSTIHSS